MVHYRPFVDAIQWLGTNVIPIRQFINSAPGVIRSATIRDGILYVTQLNSTIEVPVPVNNWLIISGLELFTIDNNQFVLTYVLDSTPLAIR